MPETDDTEELEEKRIQMFKTRLLSGIVLVVIALILVITGGNVLLGGLFVISLIGMFELYRIFRIEKASAGIVGYLAVLVLYGNLLWGFFKDPMAFVMALLILLMFVYVFTYPKYKTEQVMAAFFGVFYVAAMLSCIYQTRMLENGAYIVWLIFLCSWGCDTCAYCVGMLLGKHKLAPVLSPKKSIEGAVGGVVGAALLGLLYASLFGHEMTDVANPHLACAAACGIAAVISQIGDLAASAIKRNHEVKDYGHLIPGHGGVLDRFDSMLFTAPAIYFALTFLK